MLNNKSKTKSREREKHPEPLLESGPADLVRDRVKDISHENTLLFALKPFQSFVNIKTQSFFHITFSRKGGQRVLSKNLFIADHQPLTIAR